MLTFFKTQMCCFVGRGSLQTNEEVREEISLKLQNICDQKVKKGGSGVWK